MDDPELATGIAEHLTEFSPPLDTAVVGDLRMVLTHWTERGTRCSTHGAVANGGSCPECNIVPPSPRAAILKELNRLRAVPFDELVELCNDPCNDVSSLASSSIIEIAATDADTFAIVLDQIEKERISPRILDKLLKLPIEKGSPVARKVEKLLHSSDLRLRLATVGQLTGEWIEREAAIKYLLACIQDSEPRIRTLATRILRLLDLAV